MLHNRIFCASRGLERSFITEVMASISPIHIGHILGKRHKESYMKLGSKIPRPITSVLMKVIVELGM